MTWTPHHNIRLAREICGYEVQTSPKGVHYIIDGDNHVRPLPDFPNDPGETLTTLAAWLKVHSGTRAELMDGREYCFCTLMDGEIAVMASFGYTITAAIAHALYLTLPPEV